MLLEQGVDAACQQVPVHHVDGELHPVVGALEIEGLVVDGRDDLAGGGGDGEFGRLDGGGVHPHQLHVQRPCADHRAGVFDVLQVPGEIPAQVAGRIAVQQVEGFAHGLLEQGVETDARGDHLPVDARVRADPQAVGDAALQFGCDAQFLPGAGFVAFGEVIGAPTRADVVVDALGLDGAVLGRGLDADLARNVVDRRHFDERRDQDGSHRNGGEDHGQERTAPVDHLALGPHRECRADEQVRLHVHVEGVQLRVGNDGLQGHRQVRLHDGGELQAGNPQGPARGRDLDVELVLVDRTGPFEGNLVAIRVQDLLQVGAEV